MLALALPLIAAPRERTEKPVLHGKHWVAITGKPLGATAGAKIFLKGGNAVDAACAMLAAVCTMYDVLSWGGETQALIFNPGTGRVVGVNALGVAPTGATPEFYKGKGFTYPPEYGPLAAVTPGTPGGLLTMLAEFGKLSLKEVLEPAIEMAETGYPMERELSKSIEKHKDKIKEWPYSRAVLLSHPGEEQEAPAPGEIFRQPDLAATLKKLVETEKRALARGKSRKDAIYAAYDRFYRGDIAEEFSRGCREQGGLITKEDLAGWKVHLEEPVTANYKGIDVYKLTTWVQGPVMLQALNMLERLDLRAMGYNSTRYIHALYQVMNLAFADRDFYYGDPYFPPEEPIRGLLSKEYAKSRLAAIDWEKNDPAAKPGDPYPYEGKTNPYLGLLEKWSNEAPGLPGPGEEAAAARAFFTGTTSIQAADEEGWVVSVTPSGGWIPACLAGRTGVGMSQRAQSFVLDAAENPFNVIAPGKRPRATLTPGLALKDGKPFLSFA
ncbi:MAG TPA: gamma-glutamyltransferase, partial [Acidobacteriota bacterium]|nr:gamma-glutamyltransferase [Acidobacteriota bacterium]